jgi:alcohol dehydrogenase
MAGRTCKALVLTGPRSLKLQEFEVPDVGDDDGLIRVEACGLCGTDHEQYTGAFPASFAFIPGHETVGRIEAIGAKARQRWRVEPGDLVAVEVFQSCGTCTECQAGEYRRCEKHGLKDMYGYMPTTKPPGLWGGYAQYQYLAPDSLVHPIPKGVDPVIATLFNPLGAGVRWGVDLPRTKEGDVVMVLGPGIRGLACLIAAKEAGARFVGVTGYGERDAERLATARRFGADITVDVARENPVAALEAAAGSLADVVIDVTAKAPAAFAQAIELARPGGTVVYAGTKLSNEVPGFWPDSIIYKELTIKGALGVDSSAYRRAIEIIASGRYPFEELSRKVVGLEEAAQLLELMAGERPGKPPLHGVIKPW